MEQFLRGVEVVVLIDRMNAEEPEVGEDPEDGGDVQECDGQRAETGESGPGRLQHQVGCSCAEQCCEESARELKVPELD